MGQTKMTPEDDGASTAERLSALERRIATTTRFNRALLLAVGLLTSGWLAGAAGQPAPAPARAGDREPTIAEVVRAHRFEMIDQDGRVRAEIGFDEGGSGGLFLYDDRERLRTCVVHDATQSAMLMLDEGGMIRLGAQHAEHGRSVLAMHSRGSESATILSHRGGGALSFYADGRLVRRVQPNE